MKRGMTIKIDSTLQRQVGTARLSVADREVALSALRTAHLIVDAGEWFVKKIEHLGARLFLKPALRA